MTERLELALLGRISVRLDGEPLDDSLTSSKARALLSYLSVTGRSHPRQAIATLLWPQLSLSDARRNLRGVLMSLRRTVGAHLEINNHSLALNQSSDYWLDVNLFRASLELPPGKEPLPEALRQALALYRGDFLEDLYVRQSPPFDEWVGELRTHLKELAVGACWALANHYAGIHDFDSAVANARRSVSLDPLSEVGWQLTMRFLALNGQRNQALSLYEELRAFLKSELSVPPSAETELLLEEIRSGWVGKARLDPARARGAIRVAPSGEKTRQAADSDLSPFVAGPPLVDPRHFFGRDRELKRLFGLFKHLPLQNGAIVGPRRSGKTSLLHYLGRITQTPASRLRPGQKVEWLPFPERYRWIFVDFQDPRMGSVESLLRFLLTQMEMPSPQKPRLEDFLNIVADQLHNPTVVLLDEIGVALSRYPELDDAFWESLRSLATNHVRGQLGFVLAGAESPDELAHHSGLGSPFFNIFGYSTELGPLSEAAAWELVASSPIPFSREDVEWIVEQSERWPILLQILCRERLLALEYGEPPGEWRADALRQMAPFQRAVHRGPV